jgi:hypothetical protein
MELKFDQIGAMNEYAMLGSHGEDSGYLNSVPGFQRAFPVSYNIYPKKSDELILVGDKLEDPLIQ